MRANINFYRMLLFVMVTEELNYMGVQNLYKGISSELAFVSYL
jgi:hypothetical protein